MTAPQQRLQDLLDLMADRACGEALGLADAARADELARLHPEVTEHSFDQAAAAIHLALIQPIEEELPQSLRHRIETQAQAFVPTLESHDRRRWFANPWLGWLAAAAVGLYFTLGRATPFDAGRPNYDQIASAQDARIVAWTPTDDPGGAGVTGDVVWSDRLGTGYMRFEGLPQNDPSEGQYQLWIFDRERPAEYPVDGGVFDATGDSIVVPIDSAIAVADPTLFAITYERPGGVVVSTRERLLLTAAPQ